MPENKVLVGISVGDVHGIGVEIIMNAFTKSKYKPYCLPSGAGHDAAAMADLTDVGMIFIRCKGGISHNPAESVGEPDIQAGLDILLEFLNVYD